MPCTQVLRLPGIARAKLERWPALQGSPAKRLAPATNYLATNNWLKDEVKKTPVFLETPV